VDWEQEEQLMNRGFGDWTEFQLSCTECSRIIIYDLLLFIISDCEYSYVANKSNAQSRTKLISLLTLYIDTWNCHNIKCDWSDVTVMLWTIAVTNRPLTCEVWGSHSSNTEECKPLLFISLNLWDCSGRRIYCSLFHVTAITKETGNWKLETVPLKPVFFPKSTSLHSLPLLLKCLFIRKQSFANTLHQFTPDCD
jgi:hypothetical protein